ncbi:MAG: DUF11 domain-containing protein, partial [Planctomycetes bacterium]|nr:DUF11 domain-containing protein [Planctomycetota bacterium]
PLDSANAAQCVVSATSPVPADNTSVSTITLTVLNIAGNPLAGVSAGDIIVSATGAGNTILGPTAATNASGQTTATLRSTVAETKTVSATVGGIPVTNTASVQFTPVPTQVAFTGQPVGPYSAGGTISVTVAIQDGSGNAITSNTDNVTISLGQNPGSGVLSGDLTKAASGGLAVFDNLSINRTGTGYTLVATSGTLTSATSSSFVIGAATPAKLVFATSPGTTPAMGSLSPTPRVEIQDNFDNLVTAATALIAIGITPGTGATGATLTGSLSEIAVNGVATFSDLKLNRAGTGYQLTATSAGLDPVDSASFAITAEPALTIVKTGPAGPVDPNAVVTYTITYGNDGLADAHTSTIVETLPAGLTFVSSGGEYDDATKTITWAVGTVLASVNGLEVTFNARVNSNPQGGIITNSNLTITCDETDPVMAPSQITTVRDMQSPAVSGLVPKVGAEFAPRQPLIQLHITDSGKGVDLSSVQVAIEGYLIYDGSSTDPNVYDSNGLHPDQVVRGLCRQTGGPADYQLSFQPATQFSYEQNVDVAVVASDLAGNEMNPSVVYGFITEQRAFGANAKVNSDDGPLTQDNPATAVGPDGTIWVVWDQTNPSRADRDLALAKLSPGADSFETVIVSDDEEADESNPVIAVDAMGHIFATWQESELDDPNDNDVFLSSSTDGGVTWLDSNVHRLNTPPEDPGVVAIPRNPSLALDSDGNVTVAWEEERDGQTDIWIYRSTVGSPEQVTTDPDDQTDPAVAIDSNDIIYVCWTDARSATSTDIYGTSSEEDAWENIPLVTGDTDEYSATGVASNDVHLLWSSYLSGSNSHIFYTNDSGDTTPFIGSSIIDIDPDDPNDPDTTTYAPSIALRRAGGLTKLFGAWQDSREAINGDPADIYYAESGSPFGTNILVNDDAGAAVQSKPVIQVDADGHPYVVWVDARNGNQDIYFAGAMSPSPPVPTEIVPLINASRVQSKNSDNLRVDIPDNALPEGVAIEDITIAEVKNAPEMAVGGNAVGLKYEFGPSGTVFNEPVLIRIPLEEDSPYTVHNVYRYDPNDLASPYYPWTDEGILNPATKITDANGICLEVGVNHFSVYGGSGATASSGGGGGGGCALAPHGGDGSPIEFFLPIFMCVGILFGSRWIQAKRKNA